MSAGGRAGTASSEGGRPACDVAILLERRGMSKSRFATHDSNSLSAASSFHSANMGRRGMRARIVEMSESPLLLAASTMAEASPKDILSATLKPTKDSISRIRCEPEWASGAFTGGRVGSASSEGRRPAGDMATSLERKWMSKLQSAIQDLNSASASFSSHLAKMGNRGMRV